MSILEVYCENEKFFEMPEWRLFFSKDSENVFTAVVTGESPLQSGEGVAEGSVRSP